MSYADALARLKKSQDTPRDALTKPTKDPSVSSVSAHEGAFSEIHAAGWGGEPRASDEIENADTPPRRPDKTDKSLFAKQGGLDAYTAARPVFEYRITDSSSWLILIAAPGEDLAAVTASLRRRFGEGRVIEVRPYVMDKQ